MTTRSRYLLYMRGFRDGAGTHAMQHNGEPDYERGYMDGLRASDAAAAAALASGECRRAKGRR